MSPTSSSWNSTKCLQTFTVDPTVPPVVVSMQPTTTVTNASSVVYAVTFSGAVAGVDASDFGVVVSSALTAGTPIVTQNGPTPTG